MPELIDGIDFVSGDIFSYQQANRMKNAWYGATAPANPVNGMIWIKSDGAVYYYFNAWVHLYSRHTESLLASVAGVDLNDVAETTLYTCPAGKSCIITKVAIRTPDGAVATAEESFGWNTIQADNVIANAQRALTGATNYIIVGAKDDAVRGAAAGTFKIDVQVAEGGARTATVDVFGYLY